MPEIETLGILDEIQALVSDHHQVLEMHEQIIDINGNTSQVSYKWLSRNFLVSSNSAKRLLQEFVEKHGSDLEVVYTLSGWLNNCPPSYNIRLVSGPRLAEAKQEFDGNCSVQVYSVQTCIPKDPAALWNAEFLQAEELFKQPFVVGNCLRDNRFCGISNSFVKHNIERTLVGNVSVQPKSAGISNLTKTSSAHQKNIVPPPQQNKTPQPSPKVVLLSSNAVKEVKGESICAEVCDQASKSSADKEKVQPVPVSKKNKSSYCNGGSLANLWSRASAKPKPGCAPADEDQICAREAEENGNSEDEAEGVNFRRASNGEGNRKRKVVFDLSDEDEYEDAVNLASPGLAKWQACQNPEQSKKLLVTEKPKLIFNELKEDKQKVKEEKATGEESNQSLKEDSSAVSKRTNNEISSLENIQSGATENDVNKDKMGNSVPNSPKRRKVLKTRIDERGREVTDVVWEGEECETKKATGEEMKKADSTTKNAETNIVTDNIKRPLAAKKSPALGSAALSNAGSKVGNRKAGNQKDSKLGNILSFFKRV